MAAEAVNLSHAILKSSSVSKELLYLRVQPRSNGGFALGCGEAYRLSHTHLKRS
jgi:hypothetical protein